MSALARDIERACKRASSRFKYVVADNSVPEDVFAREWAHVTGMCHQEGLLAFDLIADLGNGNTIDDEAFHAAFNILCSWTFCSECPLNIYQ